MKTGTLVLIGLAGFAAYYFQQLNTVADTVQIVFAGIQPQGLLKYNLLFNVQNVSNASVTINALTANVTVNGNTLGTITDFTKRTVAGTSQETIPLTFDVSLITLPSTVLSLINSGSPNLNFVVTGYANINGFVLPFSENQTVGV